MSEYSCLYVINDVYSSFNIAPLVFRLPNMCYSAHHSETYAYLITYRPLQLRLFMDFYLGNFNYFLLIKID